MVASTRIERARRRARGAKTLLGTVTAVVFGVAFVGAKAYAPGHARVKARSLGAPVSFEHAVRRSTLQSGRIAPALQPPPVATSTS